MLWELSHQQPAVYVLAGIALAGMAFRLLIGGIYKRYLRQAEAMDRRAKKWLKQMKHRFENRYRCKAGVSNIDVFVRSQISRKTVCGIRLRTLEMFGAQTPFLCMIAGLTAALLAGFGEESGTEWLKFAVLGGLGGLLCVWAGIVSDAKGKRICLALTLNDYFENYLNVKLRQQTTESFAVEGKASESEAVQEAALTSLAEYRQAETGKAKRRKAAAKTVAAEPETKEVSKEEIRKERQEAAAKKRQAKRQEKEEKERKAKQEKEEARLRKEEMRLQKKRAALQAEYEEKQNRLQKKYLSRRKQGMEEAAATVESVPEKSSEQIQRENALIEDVLKEFLT